MLTNSSSYYTTSISGSDALWEMKLILKEKLAESERLRKESSANFESRLKIAELKIAELHTIIGIPPLSLEHPDSGLKDPVSGDEENVECPVERIMREDREHEEHISEMLMKLKFNRTLRDVGFFAKYFYHSFELGKKHFFGETFDKLFWNCYGPIFDNQKYKLVLCNEKTVVLLETFSCANEYNIDTILFKGKYFREECKEYANHRLYLGIAAKEFQPELEIACVEKGIAIVRKVGDTVIIEHNHKKDY